MQHYNPHNREQDPDVMPPLAVAVVGIGWLLLFGVRSVAAPMLLFLDSSVSVRMAALDRELLLRIYLVLLSFIVLIAALRAARNAETKSKQKRQESADGGQSS